MRACVWRASVANELVSQQLSPSTHLSDANALQCTWDMRGCASAQCVLASPTDEIHRVATDVY